MSLVGMVSLASCGSDVAVESGPLQVGGTPGTLCIPAAPDEITAYGDVVSVPADVKSAVVLDNFDMDGVELQQVSIVPMEGSDSLGSLSLDNPPTVWNDKQPAKGAEIEPGESINIIAVFPARNKGTIDASPLTIEYSYENQDYMAHASTKVEVREVCS